MTTKQTKQNKHKNDLSISTTKVANFIQEHKPYEKFIINLFSEFIIIICFTLYLIIIILN